jgi:prophage regulatory protein
VQAVKEDEIVKNNTKPNKQLLRLHEVLERLPCGKTTFYKGIDLGLFPAPVRLGKRTVAWRESEVEAAILNLPRSNAFKNLLLAGNAQP